jgi:hypothetical protein
VHENCRTVTPADVPVLGVLAIDSTPKATRNKDNKTVKFGFCINGLPEAGEV